MLATLEPLDQASVEQTPTAQNITSVTRCRARHDGVKVVQGAERVIWYSHWGRLLQIALYPP
jgi:hypothetical protein